MIYKITRYVCKPDNMCRLFLNGYHTNPLPLTQALFTRRRQQQFGVRNPE